MAGQDIEAASYPGRSMAVAAPDAAPAAAREEPELGRPRLRELGRPVQLALAVVVLIGFAVRAWAATHPVVNPGPDADAYASLARALFEHHTYGSPGQTSTSDWSPGAPLLFGAVYWISGGVNPELARLVVAGIGALMVLFSFLLGLRVANRWAGLVAALLVATYPTYIENTGQLLSEPLAATLLTGALLAMLWAAERPWWAWSLPGLTLGALILTRPEYQAISVVFAALVAWRLWRDSGWRRALVSVAVLAACAVVVVVPWMARNHSIVGQWTVSTGGGKALFVATYLPGDGRQVPTKRELMRRFLGAKDPITTKELKAQSMTPLLNRVARKYPELPRDKALGRIGKENLKKYLREQPAAYLRMSAAKFWNMFERGSSPYMRDWGWVAYHRALLLLGLAGFVLLVWRRSTRWAALLLGSPIASIAVLGTILLAVPRRQVPLMPVVCVFAGAAVVAAVQWLLARRRVSSAAAGPAPAPDRAPAS
jgi:4-amino-4-deoxy-L-arabinose transferase-like glycosyltransferase